MAITIQHAPGTYYSVHGDILFVVCDIVKASDPDTYPDYRYICDVYVGSEMVARLKAYPKPDNKMGVFNIANIIRNYVGAVFNPVSLVLRAQEMGSEEFNIDATMKFGEEYGFTLYSNITVDSERKYFNNYNGRLLSQATSLISKVNKPLSLRPYHTVIDFLPTSAGTPVYTGNKNNFVPFLPNSTDDVTLRIKSYTEGDVLIDSKDATYIPSAANTLQLYNLSPAAINAAFPGLVNPAVASYYTVQFVSDAIAIEDIMRFNLVCEPKYEVFTLHFLNRFGGFESRDFTKVSRKTIDVEKQEFGKLGYVLDSSGIVTTKNENNVLHDTRSVYSTQFKEKMVLNTDILTDDEYTWLGDLILSPMVYIEIVEGGVTYFVPCSIVSNNYEFKKVINDQLTNLTINIEFGDQFNAQYR